MWPAAQFYIFFLFILFLFFIYFILVLTGFLNFPKLWYQWGSWFRTLFIFDIYFCSWIKTIWTPSKFLKMSSTLHMYVDCTRYIYYHYVMMMYYSNVSGYHHRNTHHHHFWACELNEAMLEPCRDILNNWL